MDPGERLKLRDEILEISYWLYKVVGEELLTAEAISSFGGFERAYVEEVLEELKNEGYYDRVEGGYVLTRVGEIEAKRRLEEELGPPRPTHASLLELGYIPCGDDCRLGHQHDEDEQ